MRAAFPFARNTNGGSPPRYSCQQCSRFFESYTVLLEHLYWRHGTESMDCGKCPVRKWTFAAHLCHFLPRQEETVQPLLPTPPLSVSDLILLDDMQVSDVSDDEAPKQTDSVMPSSPIKRYEFCYCGVEDEEAEMIGCDNAECRLQWFHYKCVGVVEAPEGDWYCPSCRGWAHSGCLQL